MDKDYLPLFSKSESVTFAKEVNDHLGLHPVCKINKVLNVDEFHLGEQYECNIKVGRNDFATRDNSNRVTYYPTEEMALHSSMRTAMLKLASNDWKETPVSNSNPGKDKLLKAAAYKIPGVKKTGEGFPSLVNIGKNAYNVIHECEKYISNEMLAKIFKDIVKYMIIQRYPGTNWKYTTRLCQDGSFTGYTSVFNLNEKIFTSLGIMVDENQAEQSAAEVCLRTLKFLPTVTEDKYTIQPYRGGSSRKIEGVDADKPYLFTDRIFGDLLNAFCDGHNIVKPRFYIANEETKLEEYNADGESEQIVNAMLSCHGKFFKSPSPQIPRIARELAANEVIKYFGITYPIERWELRKYLRIHRYDFWRAIRPKWKYRPFHQKGWITPRFCGPDGYNDTGVETLLSSDVISCQLQDEEYMHELVRKEMGRTPAFKGNELIGMNDISVGEADINNPNLFIIGNNDFSIKVLFEDGKVHCSEIDAQVDVLPGHNIQKLQCEYRISVPSLEVHLKAISCHDVSFAEPPLPVVTSCGVVVLCQDSQASTEDIFVLMKRTASGISFETKAYMISVLLHSLITCEEECPVTAAQCVEGIENWLNKDVKLLSEMTKDSMMELMTAFAHWDPRYNDLFVDDINCSLKDMQDAAVTELKRREELDISEGEHCAEVWELPQSEFVSRFDETGIMMEDSMFCGMRALASSSGIMMHFDRMESSPTVDIPVGEKEKHGGGVNRFYIWQLKIVGKGSSRNEDKTILKGYRSVPNTNNVDDGLRKIQYSYDGRRYHVLKDIDQVSHIMSNIDLVNTDGSKTKYTDAVKYGIHERDYQMDTAREKTGTKRKGGWGLLMTKIMKIETYNQKVKLFNYARNNDLPHPRYTTKEVTGGFLSTVVFNNVTYEGAVPCANKKDAEYAAAHVALSALGIPQLNEKQAKAGDLDLPEIPVPGDSKFKSYRDSLQTFCKMKKIGVPSYNCKSVTKKPVLEPKFHASVTVEKQVINAKESSTSRDEAILLAAETALIGFGYTKVEEYRNSALKGGVSRFGKSDKTVPVTAKKTMHKKVYAPGDSKFSSFKTSLEVYLSCEKLLQAKYSYKKEGDGFYAAVLCGDETIYTKETRESLNEALAFAAYDALCHFGYLEGISFADGYRKKTGRTKSVKENENAKTAEEKTDTSDNTTNVEEKIDVDKDEVPNSVENGDATNEKETGDELEKPNEDAQEKDKQPAKKQTKRATSKRGKKKIEEKVDVDMDEVPDSVENADVTSEKETDVEEKIDVDKDEVTNSVENGDVTNKKETGDELKKPNEETQEKKPEQIQTKRAIAKRKKRRRVTEELIPKGEGPDLSWVVRWPDNRDADVVTVPKMPYKVPPLPARNAYREHALWMKLDEAINICPLLAKVSETSEFKEQLKKLEEDVKK